jgi:hypothetical protein
MLDTLLKPQVQARLLNMMGRMSLLATTNFRDFNRFLDSLEKLLNTYESKFLLDVDRRQK